jgi:hypothetical protein
MSKTFQLSEAEADLIETLRTDPAVHSYHH